MPGHTRRISLDREVVLCELPLPRARKLNSCKYIRKIQTNIASLLTSRAFWTGRFYPIQPRFTFPILPEQTDFTQLSYDFHIQPFLNRPILPNPATFSFPALPDEADFSQSLPFRLRFSYPDLPEQTDFFQFFSQTPQRRFEPGSPGSKPRVPTDWAVTTI